MRSVAVLAALVVAGVLGILVWTLTSDKTLAFTPGVAAGAPVAVVKPRDVACQAPLSVPDGASAFDRVALELGTYGRPGVPAELSIVRVSDGHRIASARIAAGYADHEPLDVAVGHVSAREPFRVCVRNAGRQRLAVYGSADAASRSSTATLDGRPLHVDLSFVFERDRPRSIASLVASIADRAALFRVSWLGGWVYVLLALVVIAVVPLLLGIALRGAEPRE